MEDNISFQNMDSWRGGSGGKFGLTFKQICLMHINRCVQNGSVEWHGGFWQDRQANNCVEHYYVPDTRDVYNNSVRMLRALLLGYYDDKIKEVDNELQEEYKQKHKEYMEVDEKGKDVKFEWYSYRVNWHIRMFEELIMLSKRLNFFEEETSEEEM